MRIKLALLLLLAISVPAFAWTHGNPGSGGGSNFQNVFKIGGGGFSKNIDIANDGTKVSTVDIWGAWIAQPGTSSPWVPLVNETAFSAVTTCSDPNFSACWQGDGPYDARIAHSNSNVIFINWDNILFRSIDQGVSFQNQSGATGLPVGEGNDTGGNGDTWCGSQNFFGVDEVNAKTNVDPTQATLGNMTVIVPTARFGTYISRNGGTTFSLLSGVPTTLPGANSGYSSGTTGSATSSGATLTFSGASAPTAGPAFPVNPGGSNYNSSTGIVQIQAEGILPTVPGQTVYLTGITGTGTDLGLVSGAQTAVTVNGPFITFSVGTGKNITSITGGNIGAALPNTFVVVDQTNPFAIPPNTFVSTTGLSTVTLTNSVAGSGVGSGDTIDFYLPAAARGPYGCPQSQVVAFDPRVNTGAGLYSRNIYIADPGTGVLQSQDDGVTWTQLTGGSAPPLTGSAAGMVACSDGFVYYISYDTLEGGELYTWNGTTWSDTGRQFWGIACDPVNSGTVAAVVKDAGSGTDLFVSTNHGALFLDNGPGVHSSSADVPWLGLTVEDFSAGEIQYDPAQTGVVYVAEGIGIWHSPVVNGGSVSHTWTSQTAGVESLEGTGIIKSPSYTYPFNLYWDRALFTTTNPNSYLAPAVQYNLSLTEGSNNEIIAGWAGDWATADNGVTVCAIVNSNSDALTSISGCTSNGTTFNSQFPVEPDALSLVTNAQSAPGSSTLHFASVPIDIQADYTKFMLDVGTIATTSGPTTTNSMTLASLPPNIEVGDALNTIVLSGFLAAPGYPLTAGNQQTTALIEAISGTTLTLSVPPVGGVTIPSGTSVAITQTVEFSTLPGTSPALNVLCFAGFPGDWGGSGIVGPNVANNSHVDQIQQGMTAGVCGPTVTTIILDNNMSSLDPGNTTIHIQQVNSPLANVVNVSNNSNTSTSLNLDTPVAYPSPANFASNPDGVRAGETIEIEGQIGGAMAVSSAQIIFYISIRTVAAVAARSIRITRSMEEVLGTRLYSATPPAGTFVAVQRDMTPSVAPPEAVVTLAGTAVSPTHSRPIVTSQIRSGFLITVRLVRAADSTSHRMAESLGHRHSLGNRMGTSIGDPGLV